MGASSVPKEPRSGNQQSTGGKLGEDTSGVPEADIEIARRLGCTKVNIDTDLARDDCRNSKSDVEAPKEFDPRKYLAQLERNGQRLVRHKVENVLCCGQSCIRLSRAYQIGV